MLIDRGIQCSFEQHFHPIVAVKRAQDTLIPPRSSNSNSPFTSNLITTTTGNNIPIIPQMSRNLSQKKFWFNFMMILFWLIKKRHNYYSHKSLLFSMRIKLTIAKHVEHLYLENNLTVCFLTLLDISLWAGKYLSMSLLPIMNLYLLVFCFHIAFLSFIIVAKIRWIIETAKLFL